MPYDPEKMQQILRDAEESLKKKRNGHQSSSAHPPQLPPPIESAPNLTVTYSDWRYRVGMVVKKALDDVPVNDRPTIASMAPAQLSDLIVKQAHEVVDEHVAPWWPLPDGVDLDRELRLLAQQAIEVFRDVYLDANVPAVIPFEVYELALQANEEYLKRTPVIEGLCYSSAVSMVTGGKHAGKSTVTRWLAICVAKGLEFLNRKVDQGPVLYLASEDEAMAARQELIRLGWCATDPLQFLSMSNVTVDSVKFLENLTDYLRKNPVKLIVLDMVFDFVRISDELSYSQTREALGTIQRVATAGDCHITTVHHSPKHLVTADAAVTALGSQGLAARVSPIILIRKHGDGVHTIVSTSVRDPRGLGLEETRLIRNDDGSLQLGKAWKDFYAAEIYTRKVLDLFEASPGEELTRPDVQESLGISQPLASTCLRMLYKEGKLDRAGSGKKGKPFRYSIPAPEVAQEIREPNGQEPENLPEKNGIQGYSPNTILPDPDVNEDWERQGVFQIKDK
jgi:hypothetical protein